jgi:hypothetical protein
MLNSRAALGILLDAHTRPTTGRVVRRETRSTRVLAAGLAIWGAATALTGLANGFLMRLLLRVIAVYGAATLYRVSLSSDPARQDRVRRRLNKCCTVCLRCSGVGSPSASIHWNGWFRARPMSQKGRKCRYADLPQSAQRTSPQLVGIPRERLGILSEERPTTRPVQRRGPPARQVYGGFARLELNSSSQAVDSSDALLPAGGWCR